MEQVFTHAYEGKWWGDNNSVEYNGSIGRGSYIDYYKSQNLKFIIGDIRDYNSVENAILREQLWRG